MMEDVLVKLNPELLWKKAAFNAKTALLLANRLGIEEETSKTLHLEYSFIWCLNWTLRAVDQKHLESFEIWCWRRMEKISLTNHVRNEAEEYPT
jgi:hypothetical protein